VTTRKISYLLFLIILIDAICSGLFIPIITQVVSTGELLNKASAQLTSNIHNTVFATSFIIMLSPAYIFAAPVISGSTDHVGRKKILSACLLSSCLGYTFCFVGIQLQSLIFVIIGTVLTSLGSCSLPVILASMSDIAYGKMRYYCFGLVALAMALVIFAGQFAGYIISLNKYDSITNSLVVLVTIFFAVLNVGLAWFFLPETYKPSRKANPNEIKNIPHSLLRIATRKKTRNLLLIFFLFQLAWGLYFQDVYSYVSSVFEFDGDKSSLLLTSISLSVVVSIVLIYPLLIRFFKLKNAMLFALILMALGLIGNNIVVMPALVWIFANILAVGAGLMLPLLWSLISESVGPKNQGFIMGVVGPLWALAWAFAGIVIAPLAKLYVASSLLISMFIIVLMVIAIVIGRFRKEPSCAQMTS